MHDLTPVFTTTQIFRAEPWYRSSTSVPIRVRTMANRDYIWPPAGGCYSHRLYSHSCDCRSNFDWLFLAVWPLTTLIFGHWPWTTQIFCLQRSLDIWTATQVREPVHQEISAPCMCNPTHRFGANYSTVIWSDPHWDLNVDRLFDSALTVDPTYLAGLTIDRWLSAVRAVTIEFMGMTPPCADLCWLLIWKHCLACHA